MPTGLTASDWRFLKISPDAKQLALKSGFSFRLMDLSGLETKRTVQAVLRNVPSSGLLHSYAFSPNGKLGAGPTFDSVIHLHDLESNQTIRTLTGHSSQVYCTNFSQDGRRLLSGSEDGTVRIWDVETGDSLTTLQAHRGRVDWVGFGKDEGQIISLSRAEGTVRVWGAMSPQELAQSETYWRELALYREQAGRSEQVLDAYDQAIRLSPGDAELLLSRAELNSKLGRTDAALADYISLIALGNADSANVDAAKSLATRTPLSAGSSKHPRSWRYTVELPAAGWIELGFDDSSWKTGASPFGSDASDNTMWRGPDIWLRLEFEVADPITKPLFIDAHIDDVAEFYVNGVHAGDGRWIGSGMQQLYQRINCSAEVVAALKPGRNVLAIHCHDTGGGGAGIDARLFLDEGGQGWIDRLTEAIDEDPANVHLLQARSQAIAEQGDSELAAADAAVLLQILSDVVETELNDPDVVWPDIGRPVGRRFAGEHSTRRVKRLASS